MTFMTFSYGNLYVCIEEFRIHVYMVKVPDPPRRSLLAAGGAGYARLWIDRT